MRHRCSLVFVLAPLAVCCGSTTNGSVTGDSSATDTPYEWESGVVDSSPLDTAPLDTATPATAIDLPFAASNVGTIVQGMPIGTQNADLVLDKSSPRCGSGIVFNTETGEIRCSDGVVLGVTFKVVEQPTTPKLGVFVLRSLTIGEGYVVRVEGKNALVIVAQGDIRIGGKLLVDSSAGGYTGGDYNYLDGNGPGGGRKGPVLTEGGGGGGGYCLSGGKGGDGADPGGAGGATYGSPSLSPLVGGSGGGSQKSGGGGAGGGAIQLVAGATLTIIKNGVVHAGGRGGAHTCLDGAAGGGSGGAILLEATSVSVEGALAANGGGGGAKDCGGGSSLAHATPDDVPAKVGIGGAGAAGSAGSGGGGPSSSSTGAGGGGGAAGRIRINAKTSTIAATAIVSPSITTGCASKGALAPKT